MSAQISPIYMELNGFKDEFYESIVKMTYAPWLIMLSVWSIAIGDNVDGLDPVPLH